MTALDSARAFAESLAGRLLAFTIVIVLFATLFLFLPAMASFHHLRLTDRTTLAQTAAIALQESPELSPELESEILENAQLLRVALGVEGVRELILEAPMPANANGLATYDLRQDSQWRRLSRAMETLFAPRGRLLLVVAQPRFERGDFIEILISEEPLKREMANYAWQVALSALAISLFSGLVLYVVLTWLFVRPVVSLTQRIAQFSDAPDNAAIFAAPSKRRDELGRAERALADMAEHVAAAFKQRERLAALGAAVARIAHDLRNALATAQLVTERLTRSDDPSVRQAAPRLERAIGRAAGLAAATLRYGRAEEAAPVLARVAVRGAVEEAADDALAAFAAVTRRIDVGDDLSVVADADQLHRILANLIRNAAQAVAQTERAATDQIVMRAQRRGAQIAISIADRGGGVAEGARAHLFEPFVSSRRQEGTGLGLAIARELARAMGGDVILGETSAEGSVFEVSLPAA
ncbi:MAG: HAMP domain-containing protein [Alphaproteobacteria bacterium]|nr:HAMP domain-containing protein [Alphaproteobacteria bacterium]